MTDEELLAILAEAGITATDENKAALKAALAKKSGDKGKDRDKDKEGSLFEKLLARLSGDDKEKDKEKDKETPAPQSGDVAELKKIVGDLVGAVGNLATQVKTISEAREEDSKKSLTTRATEEIEAAWKAGKIASGDKDKWHKRIMKDETMIDDLRDLKPGVHVPDKDKADDKAEDKSDKDKDKVDKNAPPVPLEDRIARSAATEIGQAIRK